MIMINCEHFGLSGSSAPGDGTPAPLGCKQPLVVARTEAVRSLHHAFMIAGLLTLLERPVMGETSRPGMLGLPGWGKPLRLAVTTMLQNYSRTTAEPQDESRGSG